MKQKQKEGENKAKQDKDEKNKIAELILQKSGRISDKNKQQKMQAEAQNIKSAANEQPTQQSMVQADIQFCEGALSFLDNVATDIEGNIKEMNNILSSGTPQSYSCIIGFQISPLPSERAEIAKKDAQKSNDKDDNNNKNNGKNPQPEKDKQKSPTQETQNPEAAAANNQQQEQAAQTDAPVTSMADKKQEQSTQNNTQSSAENRDNAATQNSNGSSQNIPEVIRRLRFSPTIEKKPINKTPISQNFKTDKSRDI